ncbi:unnamed protein product [Diatraea saccharalis]|uniref:Glucose-1-phosphatase n=1 Tax=Diatraea saccharalis TaxID=40085 RepID=A0A9N9WKJ1_9NEOP|nr:unnamed protein product [Diatraea saccharalis]
MCIKYFFIYFCMCICISKSVEKQENEVSDNSLTLKQVVILSRHGLRSPLSKYLNQMTPKKWPSWKEKPGYLTAKGSILEGYMGKFFGAWFNKKNLIHRHCPTEDSFYAYANIKQRTLASAKAFVDNAFPYCNITIHHSNTNEDPLFNPVLHNTSSIFRQLVIEEMENKLKNLKLNSSYEFLENILDYENSDLCKAENKCNLLTDKNKVIVVSGKKPNAVGPIKIANSVVDAFVMQYYEGIPLENVAWGYLQSSTEWETLMKLSRGYHNLIFNTTLIAHDISLPIVKYMRSLFLNNIVPKVTLLMGHDANMYTVLKALKFKLYQLMNQYELTPIGGKLVFQKWFDKSKNEYLLKVEYVYQSSDQLRFASVLSLNNTPQFQLMQLDDCKTDSEGFCSWNDFLKILENNDIIL